jgi:hypothetical protein
MALPPDNLHGPFDTITYIDSQFMDCLDRPTARAHLNNYYADSLDNIDARFLDDTRADLVPLCMTIIYNQLASLTWCVHSSNRFDGWSVHSSTDLTNILKIAAPPHHSPTLKFLLPKKPKKKVKCAAFPNILAK